MASVQSGLVLFFMQKLKSKAFRLMGDIDALRAEKERVFSRVRCPFRVKKEVLTIESLTATKFTPLKPKHKHKIALYLHGGGYVTGSDVSHAGLAGKLALETGMPYIVVNYRLAPEHPYPAALEDAMFSYSWLQTQGYAPEDIILVGDSAGGGLVLSTLLKLKSLGQEQPLSAVVLSPWTDLTVTGDSATSEPEKDPLLDVDYAREWALWYAGSQEALTNPLISPLQGDLNDLAPILIQVGTREILLSDSVQFATKGAFSNTEVVLDIFEEMPHVFHFCWQYLPEAREAIRKIDTFIQEKVVEREKQKGFVSKDYQKKAISNTTVALAERSWTALQLSKRIVQKTLNR